MMTPLNATPSELMATAIAHHQAGRLQAAEPIYRRILELDPNHAYALHLLGVLVHQSGQHERAIGYLVSAIRINGGEAAFHGNLGDVYCVLRKFPQAITAYRQALALRPEIEDAYNGEVYNNLGEAYRALCAFPEATACFERALALKPDYARAHANLGSTFQAQGRVVEAIASFVRALELNPDDAHVFGYLGNALQSNGQTEMAIDCYRRAVQINPSLHELHTSLGSVLHRAGRVAESAECFERVIQLQPDFAAAHNNLGTARNDQGNWSAAIACYERAVQLQPDFAEAHCNLGRTLQAAGDLARAINSFRNALQAAPDHVGALTELVSQVLGVCAWHDLEPLARRAMAAIEARPDTASECIDPLRFMWWPAPETTARQQLAHARRWTDRRFEHEMAAAAEKTVRLSVAGRSRIKIGYLSVDFRSHPVAQQTVKLFETHARDHFEVTGYSYGPDDGSPLRRRVAAAFDTFVDLEQTSPVDAARRIEADGVDILVDLTGYTTACRTNILALRPAPIQVNYLGFPGTMGAPFMDYILVDDFVVPADQQPFFTEKLVHLPGSFMVNDGQREVSTRTPTRAECGLPETGFVFCVFNNSYKITPGVFSLWMKLLQAVPGSVLWLSAANPLVPGNLRTEAAARGVSGDRLIFAPRLPLNSDHLARYRLADLFLDTFPYNAHATAGDALWVGCPVLTRSGNTFASRVAGSLLRTIGLPELITWTPEAYHDQALQLARNPETLQELRTRLETNRTTSALFNTRQFARNVEQAYAAMWQIHRSGAAPRAFTVQPADGPEADRGL